MSCILHVARDVDEPWPIMIENNDGVMHSVDLQPGQMLFYESARLMHGRPTPMKGKYYTSVFIHYKPKDWSYKHADVEAWLPADWNKGTTDDLTLAKQLDERAAASVAAAKKRDDL